MSVDKLWKASLRKWLNYNSMASLYSSSNCKILYDMFVICLTEIKSLESPQCYTRQTSCKSSQDFSLFSSLNPEIGLVWSKMSFENKTGRVNYGTAISRPSEYVNPLLRFWFDEGNLSSKTFCFLYVMKSNAHSYNISFWFDLSREIT